MAGDDDFGLDGFDKVDGVGNLAPGSRDGDEECFGGGRRNIKRIARISYQAVCDETEIFAGDFALNDRGVIFAEELDAETTYFPSSTGVNSDGASDKRSGITGGVNLGGRIGSENFGDGGRLAVVIVLVGDDDGGYVAERQKLFFELYRVADDDLAVFFQAKAGMF